MESGCLLGIRKGPLQALAPEAHKLPTTLITTAATARD